MRKGNSEPLTPRERAELAALEAMPESAIDTRAMPEVEDWSKAERHQRRIDILADYERTGVAPELPAE